MATRTEAEVVNGYLVAKAASDFNNSSIMKYLRRYKDNKK